MRRYPVRAPDGLFRVGHLAVILPRRVLLVQLGLLVLVLALAALALMQGRITLSPGELWHALLAGVTRDGAIAASAPQTGMDPADMIARIIWDIRLPRALTAMLVGAALAMSGAAMQSVSRNPLGSPDIVGLTTGAATGALIWLMLVGPSALGLALSALAGGGLTALAVLALAAGRGAPGLVLTGFGLGAALAAVNGVILVRGDLDRAMGAALWLAGSLDARGWGDVALAASGIALAGPALAGAGRALALAEMGDDTARGLGIRVGRLRMVAVLAAVALAALATGAAGPIPFVALAAPQIARGLISGAAAGPAIATSALTGAVLTLGADLMTRTLPIAAAVPIGQMTGILGGIYLLGLLVRQARLRL